MTTYDYYSIPLRIGILIVVLSCAAIGNMALSLGDVMDANTFKCVIAMWSLLGLVGIDVSKNGIKQWRSQLRRSACQPQSSLFQTEDGFGVIDPRGHAGR